MPPARRLVVFDFDGTVTVGDGPVLAYLLGMGGDPALLRAWDGAGHADAYALVADWSRRHGVDDARRSAAYAASRAALHDGTIDVAAPDGLAAALDGRPADVRAVLVTNAPVDDIEPLLARLGLRFDALVGDAAKPAGMTGILERLLAEAALPAEALLSIGDVWANDLEPAARLGAATAFVDRSGRGDGAPTFRARSLTALLPDLQRWWSA